MKTTICFIMLLIMPVKLFATHVDLIKGSSEKVCIEIFNKILTGEAKTFKHYHLRKFIKSIADDGGIPVWESGYIYEVPYSKKIKVPFAKFDIDNDGKKEFIMSFFTWLRSRPGEYYRVLDNEIVMDGSYKLDSPEKYSWPGLYSNTPWPYSDYGLYHLEIYPFRYSGTYYLGLKDTLFGKQKFMDRSFLIIKYSNKMKNNVDKRSVTSEIECVCKFKYVD